MAISRIFPQSLPRASLRLPAPAITHLRHRSTKIHHGQFIEVDLDSASSSHPDSSDGGPEVVSVGIKKLEDAIHNIMVRRSAPDWLPFLPGYSYWVPPRNTSLRSHPAGGMIEALGRINSLKNRRVLTVMSEDEQMSLTSAKGWPSSAFFIEGATIIQPRQVLEVDVDDDDDNAGEASDSQDAEE